MSNLLRYNNSAKILVFDLETFNLCLKLGLNFPWEYASIRCVGNKMFQKQQTIIKWGTDLTIGEGASRVTGFWQKDYDAIKRKYKKDSQEIPTNQDYKKYVIDEKLCFDKISKDLEWADYIIGHNILGFDIPLVIGIYKKFSKPWQHILDKCIDTKILSVGINGEIPYNPEEQSFLEYQYSLMNFFKRGLKSNLTMMCKQYGIKVDETKTHSGVYDIAINKQLFDKLIWEFEI